MHACISNLFSKRLTEPKEGIPCKCSGSLPWAAKPSCFRLQVFSSFPQAQQTYSTSLQIIKITFKIQKQDLLPKSPHCGTMGLAASLEHWDAGLIPSPIQWVKIQCCHSCNVGHNCGCDLIPGQGTPYASERPKKDLLPLRH